MGHEITVRKDGTAEAAFALTPAWHGLGTVLDHPMTSEEAITAAHLDWRVIQREVAQIVPKTIETPEGPVQSRTARIIPGHFANVREDDGTVLGLVAGMYKVVQNREAFEFLDALIQEEAILYETAFSLRGGKWVVMVGRLPESRQIVQGDEVLRYVMLSTCHDGTGSVKFGPTSVRVVCANTYAMALDKRTTRDLAVPHTGDLKGKLAEARKILLDVGEMFDVYESQASKLAEVKLSKEEWIQYLDLLCPELDRRDPDWTERREEAIRKTRLSILSAYCNPRQGLAEGTAWAAFNAVTEHVDHLPRRGASRRAKAEARFNVALYGIGRDMKERAFRAACRFAKVETNAG